jgi:hypothetical protein
LQGFASPPIREGVRSGAPRHAPDDVHCTPPAPWHGKSNPFFTMSKIKSPAASDRQILSRLGVVQPAAPNVPKTHGNHATRGSHRTWWSQTGSNRRPPACKAGALPTELWPLGRGGAAHGQASCQASERTAGPLNSAHPRRTSCPRQWWAWVDSNYRPHAYQACALTRLSYRPDFRASLRGKPCAPKDDPERKRNEDGETRQMGLREAPDFSIDASIARANCPG